MQSWIWDNREAFERDVLHDFCLASRELEEQFRRYASAGAVSFPVLRGLVGEPMNKGLLWRLKDKAHHLFRNAEEYTPAGALLDWTLGYIFHESLKLMEDAHQYQYYVPQLAAFQGLEQPGGVAGLLAGLFVIQEQTRESMGRETARLECLFIKARKLFCLYFSGKAGHRPLARLLHDKNALIRDAFQEDYEPLLLAVYGDEPERMHVEAAHSLLESARCEAAAGAVAAALSLNPSSPPALALRQALDGQGAVPEPSLQSRYH